MARLCWIMPEIVLAGRGGGARNPSRHHNAVYRRCGSKTPQGGKGGGGLGGWGKLYWRGFILISPIPLYTLWPHCHTPPPHSDTPLTPSPGRPPAGRHHPWGVGGGGWGAKGPFFGRRKKKYRDLPILTSFDVKPLL